MLEEGETVVSILRDWTRRGSKPVHGKRWWPTTLVGKLTSPRIAELREWQRQKYPAQWLAMIDVDTHERLVKLLADPVPQEARGPRPGASDVGYRRMPKCGRGLHYRRHGENTTG